jgi:hypothetical protein
VSLILDSRTDISPFKSLRFVSGGMQRKTKGSLQTIYRLVLFFVLSLLPLYAKAAALSSQTKLASSRANKCFSISEISQHATSNFLCYAKKNSLSCLTISEKY